MPNRRMEEPASDGTYQDFVQAPRASFELLPIEIITMIFMFYGAGNGWASLYELRLVCNGWRHDIDTSTILWSTIQLVFHGQRHLNDIRSSLGARLVGRFPERPLHIDIELDGQLAHDDECGCDFTGDDNGDCIFQRNLCDSMVELLGTLVGHYGGYMARWKSFKLDLLNWNPGTIVYETCFEFKTMFEWPAPLLEHVELWTVMTRDGMFLHAPNLRSLRLYDSGTSIPINLTTVRRLWLDHSALAVDWSGCARLEELTLRLEDDESVTDQALGDKRFENIKKLRFLGYVSENVLKAVGDSRLEQLVLRVNSPDDLQLVVESAIPISEIGQIVLGGFSATSYNAGAQDNSWLEARIMQLRALLRRNNNRFDNIILLGTRIEAELRLAGFDVAGVPHWGREHNAGEMADIKPWSEDEYSANDTHPPEEGEQSNVEIEDDGDESMETDTGDEGDDERDEVEMEEDN